MKVDLLLEPWSRFGHHNYDLGPRPSPIKRALPWYTTKYSRVGRLPYIHRVRSGMLHMHIEGNWSTCTQRPVKGHEWVSFRLWCGQSGSTSHGVLLPDPPEKSVVCATCEGRAVGAGFPSGVLLATRPIRFAPRLAS